MTKRDYNRLVGERIAAMDESLEQWRRGHFDLASRANERAIEIGERLIAAQTDGISDDAS